jgi:hypothetical protein
VAAEELFNAPSDLTLVSDDDLADLEARGTQEFDRVSAIDDVDPETLQYAMRLTDDLDRLRAELSVREVRAQRNAELARTRTAEQLTALQQRVHGDTQPGTGTAPATVDPEAIAAAAARGVTAGMVALMGERRGGIDTDALARRATATLAETAQHAPKPRVPEQRLAVTASVDIPGVAHGDSVRNLRGLADVVARKAKSMPVTRNNPNHQLVATIRNEFQHTVDDRTSAAQVEELVRHLTGPDKQQALVAGGGWCAPSEIRYDFFNIACADGLIDLPTFGVTRGGVQFPVSPSLADALGGAFGGFSVPFSNESNPWLWTEADDIATVTGTPNKPCVRVPCPEFHEERLECYGICLTAGNLTDDAYPEATQNMLRLLMSAHAHAMNARLIALMVAQSSAPIAGGEFAGGATPATAKPAFQQILSGIDLGATDYRARYGMCIDDVLEVVAPYWLRNVVRADLAWRTGVDLLSVPDSQITSFFSDRNLRVQWVNDWQVRGNGQFGAAAAMTAWPTTADIMIYAAGTFLHGNGMSLDLGVVRDSVLNAENDHTAAWSEECHLIARVGHESRQYRLTWSVMGATTVANLVPGTHIDAFPNL